MTEKCTDTVNYKYNEKTSKCVLSDTGNNDIIITTNDKIEYKDNMYIYKDKKEHCNNYTEKWQDWFCIKYYYLNNNYEQGIKNPEDALTNTISECFKPCEDNYIAVNNSDTCESLKTFKNKKYDGFLPYDPFAIICIIASKNFIDYVNIGTIAGNHSNVLVKIASAPEDEDNKWNWLSNSDNLYEINTQLTKDKTEHDKILKITDKIRNEDIKKDIENAYREIVKYVNGIKSRNEQDQEKIKNNIKTDLYNFFVLFDKRDEFYIDYLEHIKIKSMTDYFEAIKTNINLKGGKRGGRGGGGGMEYAYNLAKKYDNTNIDIDKKIEGFNNFKTAIKDDYVMYLFYHACDMCFSQTSIFRSRLKNFLEIHEMETYKDDLTFFDYENNIFKKVEKVEKEKLNKPLIPVKIEKENIKIFGEYTEAFNYYKNILNLFPIILLVIIAITVIFVILKITNTLIYPLYVINAILSGVLLIILFAMKLIVNSSTIGIISLIIIQPAIFIYEKMLSALTFIILSVIFFHIEPMQLAAPANNNGVDYRWIFFNMLTSIILSLMGIISLIIRELLKSNVLFSLAVFFFYTIYAIIMKGDDVLDIVINADTSFLYIIDLKYKIYKNKILLDLYNNYIDSFPPLAS